MTRNQANGLLLFATILWGTGNVAQQTVLSHVGPFTAQGLRMLIALAVILPICLRSRSHTPRLNAPGWACAAMVAASFAIASTLLQIGYGHTSVTNAGFLVNTATVITPLVAWFVLLQRPSMVVWPAAALTLAGTTLMGGGGISTLNLGDILCLASAFFYAIWMVFLGEFVRHHGSAGFVTVLQFGTTAISCLCIALVMEDVSMLAILSGWRELLFLGVFSTGLGYFLQAVAQSKTSATEAAIIVSAEALVGALTAALMLGESMNQSRALGAVLISLGILAVQFNPTFTFATRRRYILAKLPVTSTSKGKLP
jgi:drug/metabolite transporter (DMT)-like permease